MPGTLGGGSPMSAETRAPDSWWCSQHSAVHLGEINDFSMEHRADLHPLFIHWRGEPQPVEDPPLPAHVCIDYPSGDCSGPVAYHAVPSRDAISAARCDRHWARRLENFENSIERYADSDVPPAWFDPTVAGERWNEDD